MFLVVFLLLIINAQGAGFFNDAIMKTGSAPLRRAPEASAVCSAESVGGFASAASSSSVPSPGDEVLGDLSSSSHSPEMETTEEFSTSEHTLAKIVSQISGAEEFLERTSTSLGETKFFAFEKALKSAIINYGEMYNTYVAQSSFNFFKTALRGGLATSEGKAHLKGVLHSEECSIETREEALFDRLFKVDFADCVTFTEEDKTIIKRVISKAGREIGISLEIIALWKKDFEL